MTHELPEWRRVYMNRLLVQYGLPEDFTPEDLTNEPKGKWIPQGSQTYFELFDNCGYFKCFRCKTDWISKYSSSERSGKCYSCGCRGHPLYLWKNDPIPRIIPIHEKKEIILYEKIEKKNISSGPKIPIKESTNSGIETQKSKIEKFPIKNISPRKSATNILSMLVVFVLLIFCVYSLILK